MSVSFQQVRMVAEEMGRERKNGIALALTEQQNEVFWKRLVEEMLHLFDRFGDFASAILHSQVDSNVMFMLSSHFIQVSKLDLSSVREEYGGRLPLPAVEAISNQLLVLAETHPAAYLMTYALLPVYVFPCQAMRDQLQDASIREDIKAELAPFLDALLTVPHLVARCEPLLSDVSDREQLSILNQVAVFLETADWLDEELSTYEKWTGIALS